MPEQKQPQTPTSANPTQPESAKPGMTAAQAAKAVKRTVTELVDGKDADGKPAKVARTKKVSVSADEVLSFKDYGTHVVVVTRDGRKLSSADAGAGTDGE